MELFLFGSVKRTQGSSHQGKKISVKYELKTQASGLFLMTINNGLLWASQAWTIA